MNRTALALGGALASLALLTACADDGRTLRAPPPDASAPPLTSTTVANASIVNPTLTLASPSFDDDGAIPIENTCDGENASPPLTWGAVPESTVELAITVTDTDANGFVHWVITNIDPAVQAISIGNVPDGSIQAKNGAGSPGWTGPCPPPGSVPHHYVFTLYSLSTPSGVTADMTGADAIAAIEQHPALTASLTGLYQRAG
jgi:Raf kinase inhibitor-like YbhB/YbcL family protein